MYQLFGLVTRVRYYCQHKPQFPNLLISFLDLTNFSPNKTSQVLLFVWTQTYLDFLSYHPSVILKIKSFSDRSPNKSSFFSEYIVTVCYQPSHLPHNYNVHILFLFCCTHFKAVKHWPLV